MVRVKSSTAAAVQHMLGEGLANKLLYRGARMTSGVTITAKPE